ncbi:hypothetical protein [Lacipirellula parvula]|uniref:Uncharacterized protein n=1 Tax=Lacipirellula parvula TaxID=2650471 RepID=A0A5K7XMN3_9BACT|nr:hypothetical protein [Lacipirellula parvula]BBO36116.1 hypothetical protein PLANPX_5728 [Lacipirellula parvula]
MPTSPQELSEHATAFLSDAGIAPGLKNRGLNNVSLGPKFSLRTLLLVTALGAAVAAAAGIAYRAAPAGSRATLLTCWLTIAAVHVSYLAFQWRAHTRRLTLAGPIRFTLQRPDLRNDSNAAIILAAFVFVCFASLLVLSLSMAVLFTLHSIDMRSGPGVVPTTCFGVIVGFMMVAAIHFLYRPFAHARPILLGDQGVIVRRRVLRWQTFKRASWHHLLPNWLMLYGSGRKYAAAVPDALKTEVEALVAARTRFEVDQTKLAPGR